MEKPYHNSARHAPSSKGLEKLKEHVHDTEEEEAVGEEEMEEDEAVSPVRVPSEINAMHGQIKSTISSHPSREDNTEEVDTRSIYVGNVDYSCTSEEVRRHFQSCGVVNRVTILTSRFGRPKGYAYVEFLKPEAVQNAVHLNESLLHNRPLKVIPKRTNIPGMKQSRGRPFNSYVSYHSRRPYNPSPYAPSNFRGRSLRFQRPNRFRPY